ncbi:MAG: prepilin-type N-terminal cleavage/methylation domain-containing protein [Lachnospiraceae bacterium]|nr:prepilin-type N-terminal cleavage/methylation domain-containing protein [Lachnospiraceae bacterium]
MKKCKDLSKAGFSLIELIITIAIMAILASSIIGMMAYIGNAKARKGSELLNSKLDTILVSTMSKDTSTNGYYMYVFKDGDEYKAVIDNTLGQDGATNSSAVTSTIKKKGFVIPGNIKMYFGVSGGKTEISGDILKIGYNKADGSFKVCQLGGDFSTINDFTTATIYLEGSDGKFQIKMIKTTGRHTLTKK